MTDTRLDEKLDAQLDTALDVFEQVKRRLFGIAYRILGSVADAEDIVQEVWLRWQACDRVSVREPEAYLATAATRLAINVGQSARARHENYIGPWLPEPVDTSADPLLGAERGELMEFAVLLLLQNLSPMERAAYVLREAFDYPYEKIAEVIGTTAPATRQLVSRARKHLAESRAVAVDGSQHRRLFGAFITAAKEGDIASLENLLAADVVSYTDSNGAVHHAARRPIVGRETVTRFFAGLSKWLWTGLEIIPLEVNGRAAVVLIRDGSPFALLTVTTTISGISQVLWVMNPKKLGSVIAAAAGLHVSR